MHIAIAKNMQFNWKMENDCTK